MPVNFWLPFKWSSRLHFSWRTSAWAYFLFVRFLHILATCVDSSSQKVITFPNTICWAVICVLTSHSPHSGCCTQHTPENTFGRSPTCSLLSIQRLLYRTLPCIRFQQQLSKTQEEGIKYHSQPVRYWGSVTLYQDRPIFISLEPENSPRQLTLKCSSAFP